MQGGPRCGAVIGGLVGEAQLYALPTLVNRVGAGTVCQHDGDGGAGYVTDRGSLWLVSHGAASYKCVVR